jgi:hypothetical protein
MKRKYCAYGHHQFRYVRRYMVRGFWDRVFFNHKAPWMKCSVCGSWERDYDRDPRKKVTESEYRNYVDRRLS